MTRVLLAGAGHSHLEVLRQQALAREPRLSLVLVSPEPASFYSGMLPGVVAGLYAPHEASIRIAPLAHAAGAQWIADRVVALDHDAGSAALASGGSIAFDVVSLDVGSQPDARLRGAGEHAVAVRPAEGFFVAWHETLRAIGDGRLRRIAVIGGGAGGVELALAIRGACNRANAATPIALVTDGATILANHGRRARALLRAALRRHAVDVHTGASVASIEPGSLVTTDGVRIEADRVFLATTAVASAWLAQSGLRCDVGGFVLIDDSLQSISHPFVFASGDCATMVGRRHPKSGAIAVRQGPVLAANLRGFARGTSPERFAPRRITLSLIGTGDRSAVLSYGGFAAQGAWVWHAKEGIDRRHVLRYATLSRRPAGSASGRTGG